MTRTERFGLVLTPSEKNAVKRLAELEGGLSKAALVRRLIRKAALDRGVWPDDYLKSNENKREAKHASAR